MGNERVPCPACSQKMKLMGKERVEAGSSGHLLTCQCDCGRSVLDWRFSVRPPRPLLCAEIKNAGGDLPQKKWTGLSCFSPHLYRGDISDSGMEDGFDCGEALDEGEDIAPGLCAGSHIGDGERARSSGYGEKLSIRALS